VATLSQQLSWSHFVELLPIKDRTEREFYAVMCLNEQWDVRTLRDRKKSMLFQRIAKLLKLIDKLQTYMDTFFNSVTDS